MRMFTFIGVLTALCWLTTSASAQNYRDTSGDAINPGKAINESPTNTDIQLGVEQGAYRAPNTAPDTHGNHWRYRFQNSQWWYYQPNNRWVIWNGKSWVEPSAMTRNGMNANGEQPHQSGYRGTPGMNQPQGATPAETQAPQKQGGQAAQANQPNAASPAAPAVKTPTGSNQ
jgi:hypothetical protein